MSRRPLVLIAVSVAFLVAGTSVEEQRSRLPPADTDCSDTVTGTWASHVFFPHVQQWYRFTLDVHRDGDGGALKGGMRADYWNGGPDDAGPVECGAPHYRHGIVEEAVGTIDGQHLKFDATTWKPDPTHPCADDPDDLYLLDHFEGTIDPAILEFQAVLNADAPEWTDVPMVFRRVSCTDEPKPTGPSRAVPYTPPEKAPARRKRGWSCW